MVVEPWTALARRGMMSCKSGAPTASRDVPQLQLSFSAKDDSLVRPILLTLYQATNVTIQNINMINGPEWINFVCNLATPIALSTRLSRLFDAAGQRGEEHRLPQHHDLRRVDILARREEHGRVGHLPERQRHHRRLHHQQRRRLR